MKHLLTFTAGLTLALSGADRPNILVIFSDDHAPNAISSYPGGLFDKIAPTKGIDRIAREGIRFDRSTAPMPSAALRGPPFSQENTAI